LELIEIAPGIDLEKDILAHMDFKPVIDQPLRPMDARLFRPETMNLKEALLQVPLEERLLYDPQENLFFINFEGYEVKRREDIEAIRNQVEVRLAPLGHRVFAIVNYDNFTILPDLIDDYMDMVQGIVERFYSDVTRYTTSTFLRMKLGDALEKRNVAPHIYESQNEARRYLQSNK
jgi:propionate CoA-transferase